MKTCIERFILIFITVPLFNSTRFYYCTTYVCRYIHKFTLAACTISNLKPSPIHYSVTGDQASTRMEKFREVEYLEPDYSVLKMVKNPKPWKKNEMCDVG